jgi:hypothetical protein
MAFGVLLKAGSVLLSMDLAQVESRGNRLNRNVTGL